RGLGPRPMRDAPNPPGHAPPRGYPPPPRMSRFATVLTACLAAASCARSVGPARTSEEARSRVAALLDAPDAGVPEFAGIGPEAVPALQAELLDTQASDARR